MTDAYVAAGSNVEPIPNLRRALDALAQHFAPLQLSRAYRNAAVGFEGEDFVNLVVKFQTDLPVAVVLERLHEAEAACGRERAAPKWAPRAMDLDILLFGDMVCAQPGLTLPRPDLLRRAYMLRPLAELAPDLVHPAAHARLRDLWREMQLHTSHVMTNVDLGWQSATASTGNP